MGLSNIGNPGPGFKKEMRAGYISLRTAYLEREHEIVEVAGLTKGRAQKEEIREARTETW